MLTSFKSWSLVLVMISSMSVPIFICFHFRRANTSKITTFKGYPYLMPTCAGILEPRWLALEPLKSALYAENFIHRLSRFISSHFIAIHLDMCAAAKNCEKFTKNPYFEGSMSFKVTNVDKSKKLVTSAYYGKQHVCTYLQPFSRYTSQ